MTEVLLRLEAPDRPWAEHIQSLIQRALGQRGSVQLNLPPVGGIAPTGYIVFGKAICDEPEDEIHVLIKGALVDYSVNESQELPDPIEFLITPSSLGRYWITFPEELSVEEDEALTNDGFIAELSQGPPLEPEGVSTIDIGRGAPYRVQGETEGEIRNRLLIALEREPKELRIVRPAV